MSAGAITYKGEAEPLQKLARSYEEEYDNQVYIEDPLSLG